MGLLSKASEITPVKLLAFTDFIISNKIKTFAIFHLENNFYKIINSIGFDGASLLSSESSKDFWNGICDKLDVIYNFTCYNKSLNPILQFFSFSMKDQINTVSLVRTNEYIYMLCNKDLDESLISDLKNIDFSIDSISLDNINKSITSNSKLYKYEIDFDEALDSFILSKKVNKDDISFFKSVLFNELYNRFACQLAKYAVRRIGDFKLNVLLNSDRSINEDHLIYHIIFSLKGVVGSSGEMLTFNKTGEAESIKEVKDFLQVG